MGKIRDLHYELLEHPPYSPDLAPSDFHLFQKLKIFVAGLSFSSNQEAIAAVEGYFADSKENHYRDEIMALEHRWNKCTCLKGDYVEKNNSEIINSFFHCWAEKFSDHPRIHSGLDRNRAHAGSDLCR
jgi:hypothetical protein